MAIGLKPLIYLYLLVAAAGPAAWAGQNHALKDPSQQAGLDLGRIDEAGGMITGLVRNVRNNVQRPVSDALVWVSGGLDRRTFAVPKEPLVIDQQHMQFTPHVSAAVVDQTIEIRNSDETFHNVKMNSRHNGRFNHSMFVTSHPLTTTFKKPEIGTMLLRCDVHPLMLAFVHVLEHPFFCRHRQGGTISDPGRAAGAVRGPHLA